MVRIRAGAFTLLMSLLAVASPAFAQPPSLEQRAEIRQACRGDYVRYCLGVRPVGPAGLQCLEEHEAATSPPCQKALAKAKPTASSDASNPAG